MDKIYVFNKVLDVLNDDGKDKLLISAQLLINAQKTVKARPLPTARRSSGKTVSKKTDNK
jgi:hypothetical protein